MSSQREEQDKRTGVSAEQSSWALPNQDDLSGIGKFAEALRSGDKGVVARAESALVKLLPELISGDAELLSAEQRECLYGSMEVRNINGKSELIAAALGALARIGDVAALPTVITLASCQVDSSACRRVKTAAEASLQILQEIEAINDPSKSLLRASDAAVGTTDTLLRPIMADSESRNTLLRPASQRPDDHPDELLRATEHD